MDIINPGLVSIAIPAYKRHWLGEAITSALTQDYQNIELLIVDDHSPQNLKEVVAPFLSDSRVHYYYNEENLGKKCIVYNWNRCLELASGEYFVLLCDDDVLLPSFVSTLLKLAEKYPQCNVFHGRRLLKNELTGETVIDAAWPDYETSESYFEHAMLHLRMHTITEFMYRKRAITNGYHVFPCGFYSDDVSLLEFVNPGGIASSKNELVIFRTSDEHISTNTSFNRQKAEAALLYMDWLKKKTNNPEFINAQMLRVRRLIYLDFISSGFSFRLWFFIQMPHYIFPLSLKTSMVKVMFKYWKW